LLRHATNLRLTINTCRVSVLADTEVRLSTTIGVDTPFKGQYTISDL
jgi:hypothetical protein